MPRPRLLRRVFFQPGITYFKPAGIRMIHLEEVIITIDEFETLRLKDFENLEQNEAAKKMNISQPTFHRLILSARKKIADAIVNGKAIKIEGGNYKMMQQPGMGRRMGCRGVELCNPIITCICPKCGHQQQKQRGVPCNSIHCPKCGEPMVRGK